MPVRCQVLRRMYPPCGAGKTISPILASTILPMRGILFHVLAEGGTHHNPAPVVVLGPCDLARVEVDLTPHMDQVLGEMKVRAMQREYLAGTHRLLSDREDCSLKNKPVVVGAAFTRAAAQPLVLLVGDDLEVGPVHPPLALARAEASEMVTRDQVAVQCVIEELPHRLLDVGALRASPRHRFVTSKTVKRPVVKLTDERAQSIA